MGVIRWLFRLTRRLRTAVGRVDTTGSWKSPYTQTTWIDTRGSYRHGPARATGRIDYSGSDGRLVLRGRSVSPSFYIKFDPYVSCSLCLFRSLFDLLNSFLFSLIMLSLVSRPCLPYAG